jgi:4-amino-4-deoxy-L-arabinose transferase-like glycosyltransferase
VFVSPFAQVAALAIAPVAVFVVLRVRPMAQVNSIDPFLHMAYIEHGRELIDRFGTVGFTANYQWARVGFIIPAHVFFRLFGAVTGFYAFRYALALLAVVPVYLLFRRLHGPRAGWIAVLLVLTCPIILVAWGSDYPDSAAVSYLLAGTACLVMPAPPRWRRLWVLAAGALFALALHSHVVTALAAGGAVVGYVVVFWRRPILASLLDVLLLGTAVLAITAILVIGSYRYYGQLNVFAPTIDALVRYRVPSEIAKFHSTTWKWMLYDVYLLVPPAVIAAWVALSWRLRDRLPREEAAIVLGSLATLVAYTLAEFVGRNWTLEYYFYTSLLFAGGILVLATVVVRISGPLLRSSAWAWAVAPIGLVIVVPVLLRPLRPVMQFELPIAAVIAMVVVALAFTARTRLADTAARRLPVVAILLVALTALMTGEPLQRPFFPGQMPLAIPDYGSVLFTDGGSVVDDYAVASQLRTVVPSAQSEPGAMVMWWPQSHQPVIDQAAAQYLWVDDALTATMPALDDAQVAYLLAKDTRWLVLLGDDGREFGPAMEQLQARGFTATTWREQELRSASVSMRVRVVELTGRPATARSRKTGTIGD